MWTNNLRTQKNRGFSIAELLVVMSIIMLLSAVVASAISIAREKAIVSKISNDISGIIKIEEMYITQNNTEPCHNHDLSDNGEKVWSVGYTKAWPISPVRTKYFLSHTGPQAAPTATDYYYIGVTLDPVYAQLFDQLYDDNNPNTGLFRVQATPPPLHYSYFLSYVATGSHKICP